MRITPESAAKILNRNAGFVRKGLQQCALPFGAAVKTSETWSYDIRPPKLAEYMGISLQELEALLEISIHAPRVGSDERSDK